MSFSPAELRELVSLKDTVEFSSSISDFSIYFKPENTRIQDKNVKILQSLIEKDNKMPKQRRVDFRFNERVSSIDGCTRRIIPENPLSAGIHFDILVSCVGFVQNNSIYPAFQDQSGKINCTGSYRVHSNIYACGWARTGPKGTIVDSMIEAEKCAHEILTDLSQNRSPTKISTGTDLESFTKWTPSFK